MDTTTTTPTTPAPKLPRCEACVYPGGGFGSTQCRLLVALGLGWMIWRVGRR